MPAETNTIPTTEAFLPAASVMPHLGLVTGMTVGDFGVGGAAYFALPAAERVGTQGSVLMFDVMKSALSGALSLAKLRGYGNCKAVWCNLEVFQGCKGVADNSLDAGLIVNVLHNNKKFTDMLVEIHRMLKPGAKLLIVDWKTDVESPIAPPVDRRISAEHIEQVGQTLGFAPFEHFEAGPLHWGLVLVKT